MNGTAVRKTSDAVIIASGKPIRLFGATITSGAIAGTVSFYDGTSASGTLQRIGYGKPNQTSAVEGFPAEGELYPNGLYVDLDGNASAVVVHAMAVVTS